MAAAPDLSSLEGLPREAALEVVRATLARKSLGEFYNWMWPIFHGPSQRLHWSWYLDAIADHLTAVWGPGGKGCIDKLVINISPGMAKSWTVSVGWPAWLWMHDPTLTFLGASKAAPVALRNARNHRKLVSHPKYVRDFAPQWELSADEKAAGYFANTAGGYRISRATGADLTGLRAIIGIEDDPLDASAAQDESAQLTEHVRWHYDVWESRLDNAIGANVLVMQRLHDLDLSAEVMREGGWEVLVLPNEWDCRPKHVTVLGFEDPRNDNGELLAPKVLGREKTDKIKAQDPVKHALQYQQITAPKKGSIFQRDHFRYWHAGELPAEWTRLVWSWDTTWSNTKDSDFCCGMLWGVAPAPEGGGYWYYLLEEYHAKGDYLVNRDEVIRGIEQHEGQLDKCLIEKKSSGEEIITELEQELGDIIEAVSPTKSKPARAKATLPLFREGRVRFPDRNGHRWVSYRLEPELLVFPRARNDDQVDAMTQALNYLRDELAGGGAVVAAAL